MTLCLLEIFVITMEADYPAINLLISLLGLLMYRLHLLQLSAEQPRIKPLSS